ncbi:RNA polymerase sigma factor [Streptacidiphilus carbonis]|uniref:RNA polymerase sigma factor n=1 Tax=Streptacidiphilus carbonis TaxID=105422 RepID=UPI0005A87A96|nr:sigma-70 family RNA polymerase sigma factor [Streptacidiphilus carbonis]
MTENSEVPFFSTGGPDGWSDREAPPWQVLAEPVVLPLDCQAFYLSHVGPYQGYAETVLGDSGAAWQLIHEVFVYIIAVAWSDLLDEPELEASTWEVLRSAVAYESRRNVNSSPSFFWRITFGHAMASSRLELAAEQDEVRQAIAQLPARQFDVMVLLYLMGRSRRDVAWLLGLHPNTVDHHRRLARRQLRKLLGGPVQRIAIEGEIA